MKILITGASRGIGKELVKRYLNKASVVYAVASDKNRLNELKKISNKIEIISLDLSNLDEVRNRFKDIEGLDLLIFNAAISLPHSSNFPTFDDFKKSFDINLLSIHAILESQLPKMQKRKRGKIVFISSLASIVASPTSIAYSSTKRALNSYAQSLRNLVKKDNIDVVNILPGFIKTDMTAKNNFYMPFLMDLDKGVDRIYNAIETSKKEYAFPKRFYYILKLFNLLPLNLQDYILQRFVK